MSTELNPELFRAAARELGEIPIFDTRGCCWALDRAYYRNMSLYLGGGDYHTFFRRTLRPRNPPNDWWYTTPVADVVETDEMRRNARILGLLLCALLVEEGFEP
jgi:hypothetical protein